MKKLLWGVSPVLLLVAACSSGSAPAEDEVSSFAVGASSFAGFAAVVSLAESDDAAIDVEVVEFGNSAERAVGLINGEVDMALLGWTQIAELTEQEGADLVVIASNFERGRTLIAAEGSGINSIEDLEGKTVAYSTGSMVDLDINTQLASANLSIDDVDGVNMSFSDMVIALANGDIDAYYGSEPQSSNSIASQSGYLVQYPYDEPHAVSYGDVNGALVTTRSYLEENREDAVRFLEAYVAETDALNSDPDRTAALISEMVGETNEEIIELTMGNLALVYSLDGYDTRIEELLDVMIAQEFISERPTYADMVDTSLLEEVLG